MSSLYDKANELPLHVTMTAGNEVAIRIPNHRAGRGAASMTEDRMLWHSRRLEGLCRCDGDVADPRGQGSRGNERLQDVDLLLQVGQPFQYHRQDLPWWILK